MPEWLREVVACPCFLPCGVLLVLAVGSVIYFFVTGGKIHFFRIDDDD